MPTMKAAVVRDFGMLLAIEDVPVPQPAAGEVLALPARGIQRRAPWSRRFPRRHRKHVEILL